MRLAEFWIEGQGHYSGFPRFGRTVQIHIAIEQADMSQRVLRILFECLPKEFESLLHAVHGQFVPEKKSLQIKLVGLRAFRLPRAKSDLVTGAESESQAFGNLLRNRFLHREDIRKLTVVLRAPKMAIVGGID